MTYPKGSEYGQFSQEEKLGATWERVPRRQADGFLQEGQFWVVEAEGLIHGVGLGFHADGQDGEGLAAAHREGHLDEKTPRGREGRSREREEEEEKKKEKRKRKEGGGGGGGDEEEEEEEEYPGHHFPQLLSLVLLPSRGFWTVSSPQSRELPTSAGSPKAFHPR